MLKEEARSRGCALPLILWVVLAFAVVVVVGLGD